MKSKKNNLFRLTSIFLAFFIFTFSVNSYKMNINATNTDITYAVYNPISGEHLLDYTLPRATQNHNSRYAIGEDNRVVDYTKSGVVKIYDNNNINGTMGSGFVVGDHVIATAAHCVCDKSQYDNSVTFENQFDTIKLFNSNGSTALTISGNDILSVHVPYTYINAPHNDGDAMAQEFYYDYALIYVNQDLSDYNIFNLGCMLDSFAGSGNAISITGFPAFVNNVLENNQFDKHKPFTGNGQVTTAFNSTFKVNVDISGGNSGGPAYVTTSYNGNVYYTVIGIAVAQSTDDVPTYNICNRLTSDQLRFYKNNPYI